MEDGRDVVLMAEKHGGRTLELRVGRAGKLILNVFRPGATPHGPKRVVMAAGAYTLC